MGVSAKYKISFYQSPLLMKPDENICENTKITSETTFSHFMELEKGNANRGVLLWWKFLEKSRPTCNLPYLVTAFPQHPLSPENSSFHIKSDRIALCQSSLHTSSGLRIPSVLPWKKRLADADLQLLSYETAKMPSHLELNKHCLCWKDKLFQVTVGSNSS